MIRSRISERIARFQSLLALALLLAAMSVVSDRFLTIDNGLNVLRQISINLFCRLE
jgi:ribose transport system permease protein